MSRPIPILLTAIIVLLGGVDAVGEVPFASVIVESDATAEAVLDLARTELAGESPVIESADLRIEQVRHGLTATHFRYGQWIGDRRVHGGELILSVSPEGRITWHHTALAVPAPQVSWRRDLIDEIRRRHTEIAHSRVLDQSFAYRNRFGLARAVERFVVEDSLFLQTIWEVDAETGQVLSKTPTYASLTGRVFPANPVTTLNDSSLRDLEDSAAAVPEGAYEDAELKGLAEVGELAGPAVKIVDIDSPLTARARIEDGLIFDRGQDEFEEVNAYHHIDLSQRYLQSLGYVDEKQIVPEGLRVDVHANRGADNSFYTTTSAGPTLLFGDGGVDDAEDPDIVLHEYGHAIHDSLSPGVLFGGSESEARAISEGFGDYWAFSGGFGASVESGRDPFCVGDWDARCDGPSCSYPAGSDCLRRVDLELTIRDFVMSSSAGTEHRNGRIWSTFLRDLFMTNVARHGVEDGRRRTDTLILEALQGLPNNPGFDLVVDRMIGADEGLYGGDDVRNICTAARAREFGIPQSCRTVQRGETLVVPDVGPVTVFPGTKIERHVALQSEAVVREVMVRIGLGDEKPSGLQISLVAPDGTRVVLKAIGSKAPKTMTFGRDRLPFEPLDSFEGRPNPGVWTLELTLAAGGSPITLEDWTLILDLELGEQIEDRGSAAGSRFFPAVAHTPGAERTFFVTDLSIANPGPPGELILIFTASGADGTVEFSAVRLALPAGVSIELKDLVASVFDSAGTGSLEIRGAPLGVRVTSRTYNTAPSGTFGQTIPSTRDRAVSGGRLVLSQIRRSERFRTNVGLVDLSGRGSDAIVTVHDHQGEIVGVVEVGLEPFTHRQLPLSSIVTVAELESAWAEIEVAGEDDAVAAYTSVVDNLTGDSVFVPGSLVSEEPRSLAIPAAAHVSGARGTKWRTDLWIANGSSEPESVGIHFRRDDGVGFDRTIRVDPEAARLFEDVVGELFQTEGSGWIELDPSRLTASSRTWNDDPDGSYGQHIGSIDPGQSISAGETAIVPRVAMTSALRSNVGVTEITGSPALLVIDVRDGEGLLQCSSAVALEPNRHRQWSVQDLGCGTIGGGRVEIHHLGGEGRIAGYVSIVDQKTGDPSYIPAE